jgi:MoaA/NifB/PqqE/SkfB family radical SAM enzyme
MNMLLFSRASQKEYPHTLRFVEEVPMDYKDMPKVIKGMMKNPAILYPLILNATRFTFHPLERQLLGGRSFAPRSISIMITDRCNLRCRMCQYSYCESPAYSLNQAGFMSLELFKRILDTCPGKPIIGLTGGEPLLHPQVLEFIRELKNRGFFCSLTTNGTFLTANAVHLCESKLDLLVVSIDGNEQTHDQIRGPGAYARAVAGIKEVLKLPDRPIVGITTVITDVNYMHLRHSFTLAESLGVDVLNFNHLWIQTNQMVLNQNNNPGLPQSGRVFWQIDPQVIDGNCVFDSIRSIRANSRHIMVNAYPELSREDARIYYQQPEQLIKFRSTRCAWQTMKIYPDGEVGICREHHAGNVQDQQLREIWNNKRYRDFRRYLKKRRICPICSRCCWFFSRI